MWTTKWADYANQIENRGVLTTLDSLAVFYGSQNPSIFLEHNFLDKLNQEFNSLLDTIIESDLSREMKIFLTEQIENILRVIRRYHIDGTEGLDQVAQSFVGKLAIAEHSFKDEDQKNSIYKRVKSGIITLALCLTHSKAPSPYDMIGIVPDVYDFWIPTFEELILRQEKVEQIVCETVTL